jgi:Sec-independent protein secretion pathway component TatC
MKMMLIAGLLITSPAILVVVYFFGRPAMFPALASLGLNFLPFVVAAVLLGRKKATGDEADAH